MDSLDLRYSKSVLLKIYEKGGSVIQSDLKEIVSNWRTLTDVINSLKDDGYLVVTERISGRRITQISLTEKGRDTAEKLRGIGRTEKRKSLELQPIFKLILFISEKGECKLSELKDEFPGSYSYIEDLKAEGIIEASIDNSKFPSETIISLKEKGKLIAQKLKELEEILRV